MSDQPLPLYVRFESQDLCRTDVIALYDAGDETEIILRAHAPMGLENSRPRVHVVRMRVSQVVSILGTVPPVITGHVARSAHR